MNQPFSPDDPKLRGPGGRPRSPARPLVPHRPTGRPSSGNQGQQRSPSQGQGQQPDLGQPQAQPQPSDFRHVNLLAQFRNATSLGRPTTFATWFGNNGHYRQFMKPGQVPFDYLEDGA